MIPDPGSVAPWALDTFELELRKLPGVVGVGFSGDGNDVSVHLTVPSEASSSAVWAQAEELVRFHLDTPVSLVISPPVDRVGEAGVVEVEPVVDLAAAEATEARQASGRPSLSDTAGPAPAAAHPTVGRPFADRVQLLGVRVAADGAEVEVHLAFRGERTVGRALGDRPVAAARATLEGLKALGFPLPFAVRSAVHLAFGVVGSVAVVVDGPGGERFGLSRAASAQEAAAKATLQALNRYLEDPGNLTGRLP